MFEGLDMRGVRLTDPSLTWDVIGRMKQVTEMNVIIKGIEVAEDAAFAVEYGADGIIVSNHGGRAVETGRLAKSITCLPEVVAAVSGRIPVIVDGGFRRLPMYGIGTRGIWVVKFSNFAFGQAGVEVLDLVNRELVMQENYICQCHNSDYVHDNGYRV